MDHETKDRILRAWYSLPEGCRKRPASEPELVAFEKRYGQIPQDYRWFLQACGGGTVGSEWVDGIEELGRTHEKFRAESGTPKGWTLEGVLVIGWDGAGNPYGIDHETGHVLVEDHQFRGVHEMALSFGDFLLRGLNLSKEPTNTGDPSPFAADRALEMSRGSVNEPHSLLAWISSGGIFASRLPAGADADAALDARDLARNEERCREMDESIQALLAVEGVTEQDREWIEKVAEAAFRSAWDASLGHHDLAAQVSDDMRLLAEAFLVTYRSPVVETMWAAYLAGAFPVDLDDH